MAKIKKKKKTPPPSHWSLRYAEAVGKSADFYVIAYCSELDEFEKSRNINHGQYSFVFHFDNMKRHQITRLNTRLDALWQEPSGLVLAAGNTEGYLEITSQSAKEVALQSMPGQFFRFFGLDESHLYACGGFAPFFYYRRFGKWLSVTVPEDCPPLWSTAGFHENEIYVVGDEGTILLFDGKDLRRIESPTNRRLTTIAVLNEKYLCIGGYGGTLMAGNKNGWRFVPTNTEDPILKIAGFGGKVFYGADGSLWSFDGQKAPTFELDKEVRWINRLKDGLLFGNGEAYIYIGGVLQPIDNILKYQPIP